MTKARDAADKAPVALTNAGAGTDFQVPLVSGTNIKTINSTSLLGSGNFALQPTLVSGNNIKTIGGQSLLGSGDLTVGGGSLIFLGSVTASSSATVELDGVNSTYQNFLVVATNIRSGAGEIRMQYKINGTVFTSASYSYHTIRSRSNANTYSALAGEAQNHIVLLSDVGDDNAGFTLTIGNPSSTFAAKPCYWTGGSRYSSNGAQIGSGAGYLSNTGAVTGFRFLAHLGTLTTGTFNLYGIKNS